MLKETSSPDLMTSSPDLMLPLSVNLKRQTDWCAYCAVTGTQNKVVVKKA